MVREKIYKACYILFLALFAVICATGLIRIFWRTHRLPTALPLRFEEAQRMAKENRYKEALKEYRAALKITRESDTYLQMGIMLNKLGDAKGEIANYEEALELEDPMIRENLAIAYMKQNRDKEAYSLLRVALFQKPRDSALHMHLGLVLEKLGNMNDALKEYQEALRLDPKNAAAHSNFAVALTSLGKDAEAAEQFKLALKSDPKHLDALNNLGIMAGRQGDLDTAIERFKSAIDAHPDDAQSHANLALAWEKKGDKEQAIAEYEEVLKLKPDHGPATRRLKALKPEVGPEPPPVASEKKSGE